MRNLLWIIVLLGFIGCVNDSSEIEEPQEKTPQEIVETNEIDDQSESRTETESTWGETTETAEVVNAFLNAFQKGDLDAMEECCTLEFWDEEYFKGSKPFQSYSIKMIASGENNASAACVFGVNEDLQVAIQLELSLTLEGWRIESIVPVADNMIYPDLIELQHPSREQSRFYPIELLVPGLAGQAYTIEVIDKIIAYGHQLETYQLDVLDYPMTEEGLLALYQCPSNVDESWWGGPYINDPPQSDPWNQPYHYEYPGTHNPNGFDLYSSGPDLIPGTDDDICNWVE